MPLLLSPTQASALLKEGGICAIPSETVYGLAGHAYRDDAVQRIFEAKRRPATNPLIVHYADIAAVKKDTQWTDLAERLAAAFWPGALTLVLNRAPHTRLSVLAGGQALSTVAVRMPAHPVFQEILTHCGFPLVAPSANASGFLSSTHPAHVLRSLPHVPVVGGVCRLGIESTVLDVRGPRPVLLRPGGVPCEALSTLLGEAVTRRLGDHSSPGQHASHYAPSKPLRLHATSVLPGEGVLSFGPQAWPEASWVFNLSPRGDSQEAAARLFEGLHELDQSPCRAIAVATLPREGGVYEALWDRLVRAARGDDNAV
ncbi:threonylcarbamoyl-AMP synthase [bacterium NHP-B]|nr:threonylcarbamoyl-AMP synthase [bacterium NHP-B]